LEGFCYGNLALFYDNLVQFTAFGNILWPFGIFCGNLVIFFPVLVFWTKKNLAILTQATDIKYSQLMTTLLRAGFFQASLTSRHSFMTTGNLCGKNSLDSLSGLISHAQSSNVVGKVNFLSSHSPKL
jgi:hypothetical protein